MSMADWTGVLLATILQSAGIDPTADWIIFTCADGYTAGIPITKAMDPSALVAIYMNGGRLVTAHGYPARIIVPGLYGMFHAKWVTELEAFQGGGRGYWHRKSRSN